MSAVEIRKLAEATAFAREVSGVKKPVPSAPSREHEPPRLVDDRHGHR